MLTKSVKEKEKLNVMIPEAVATSITSYSYRLLLMLTIFMANLTELDR